MCVEAKKKWLLFFHYDNPDSIEVLPNYVYVDRFCVILRTKAIVLIPAFAVYVILTFE